MEQMVKGRRMTTEKQLAPIRLNLRFLLTAVNALVPRADTDQPPVSLSFLVQLDSVKAVMSHLEQRQVGPARIYALSLLLKKVSVYLCSKQSSTSMLYISQTLPSWQLIDSYCNNSSMKRKLRQRDRLVLHTSQTTMTSGAADSRRSWLSRSAQRGDGKERCRRRGWSARFVEERCEAIH